MARTSNDPRGDRRSWRRFVAAVLVGSLSFQLGCYSYLPMQRDLPSMPEVRVMFNDRGRYETSERLGGSVDWIEGAVAGMDSTNVRVRVTRVVYLRGGSALWTGEEIEIPRAGVEGFRGRQFSKARSWAMAGVVAGAVLASLVLIDLNVFGDSPDDRCTGPGCGGNPSLKRP